ncbi:MAG: response regulator [Chitinophagaceae bacterium]
MSLPVKILVVDDEPDICYFLTDNFSRRGFTTSFANTIGEAEKKLEAEPPDILLLDNHLPDGKGVDLLGSIKTKYPDMKVVMITAHDSSSDRQKAYNNDIDFFLSKPFTMTGVNHVVDIILKEKQG